MNLPSLTRRHLVLSPGTVLDCDRACLSNPAHADVVLTPREVDIVCFLWDRRGTFVTRSELLVKVWGYRTGDLFTRTVDVHVQKLRAKLDTIPGGRTWIVTARGRGYGWIGEHAPHLAHAASHVA